MKCVLSYSNYYKVGNVYDVIETDDGLLVIGDTASFPPHDLASQFVRLDTDEYVQTVFDAVDTNWNAAPADVAEQGILAAASSDIVVKPAHYAKWPIEPITFIMRNGMEFWRGNIIKYAARAGHKLYDNQDSVESEITDLRKVIRYAEMRINQLKGEAEL